MRIESSRKIAFAANAGTGCGDASMVSIDTEEDNAHIVVFLAPRKAQAPCQLKTLANGFRKNTQ